MIIIYQINSLADFTDLRRRTTNSKTTLTTICLSLRNNAVFCILSALSVREYSRKSTQSILHKRTPKYLTQISKIYAGKLQ